MIEQPLDQGAAPVTDRREKPRIAIPRNIQTWVLAGGAVIVILAIAVSNAPGRSSRDIAAPAQTKQTLDPARLADFKKQLAAIDESARHEPAAKMPGLEQRPSPPRQAVQQDQRLTDQQRREEDSLFSSNIVATRRTGASQPIGSTGSAKQPGRDRQVAGPPSLDETAEAVVRASQRTGVPVTLPGVQPETPATPKPPAIASGPVPHQPVRTPPIDAQGPIHTLLEGTIVDAVLTNRLDGSSASPVNAMVTNPVYSHNGARIQYLYDVELNPLIDAIAARTSDVTVILDSCHSAGATKAGNSVTGIRRAASRTASGAAHKGSGRADRRKGQHRIQKSR